jgi:hypothetical protein
MPSTPKNPLDGGGSIQGAPNRTIMPQVPAYDGGQFARDSMTPSEIQVTRDKYEDEIPTDRPYHENTTPAHSNPMYVGRQYSDDWMGGYDPYGVSTVDRGKTPMKEQISINPNSADRGKES